MEDCFVERVGFRPKVGTRYGPMGLPVSIANYSGEHCVRGLGGYAKQRAGDFLVGYQAGCPGRLANQVDACAAPEGAMVTLSRRTSESDDPAMRKDGRPLGSVPADRGGACWGASLTMQRLRRPAGEAFRAHADEFAWLMDENTAVTQIDGV
ncbi:hypothetical protein MABM_41110 [Mycobacteroides abscessus]|nr:hypothetical protein MABM_41110 [Mycobacteroides abscessus]